MTVQNNTLDLDLELQTLILQEFFLKILKLHETVQFSWNMFVIFCQMVPPTMSMQEDLLGQISAFSIHMK